MKQIIEAVSSEIQQKKKEIFQQKKRKQIVISVPIWKLTKLSLGVVVAVKLGEVAVRKVKEHRQKQKKRGEVKKWPADSAMVDEERKSESDSNHVQMLTCKGDHSQFYDSAFQEQYDDRDEFCEDVYHDFAGLESPREREDEFPVYSSQFDLYEQVCSQQFGGSDYWNTPSRDLPQLSSERISTDTLPSVEDRQPQPH